MKRLAAAAVLMLFVGMAVGVAAYLRSHTLPAPEAAGPTTPSQVAARFRLILDRELLSYKTLWHAGPVADSGYVGAGSSSDTDVALQASLAMGYAAAAFTAPASRPDGSAEVRAEQLIHYLVYTHRVGSGSATDGAKWGGSDSAAVAAANLGLSAYLSRAWLSPQTRAQVADVVRFEAERYLLMSPAAGATGDSAAVSNAAASSILCVAGTVYSTGGARAAYQRRAAAYLSHVLTTYYDVTGGQPGSPTLLADLTLQYHGRFSASAELQVLGALSHCDLCYHLPGAVPPPELRQHVTDVWRRVLIKLSAADGWFISSDGEATSGGDAVSWLATAFGDQEARGIDRDELVRLYRDASLRGDTTQTPLTTPRAGQLAYRLLLYGYMAHASIPAAPLTATSLDRRLAGTTWLPSASLAVNRSTDFVTSYSWSSGIGEEWLLKQGQHLRWQFAPEAVSHLSAAAMSEAPAWSIYPDGFTTMGTMRLDSGGSVEAAIYSLPDGRVVLFEHSPADEVPVAISLSRFTSRKEPDLYRDDETAIPAPGAVRWADVDNNLGIILVDAGKVWMAPPGVSRPDLPRSSWPLVSVAAGADHTAMVVIYPHLAARQARDIAAESRMLQFMGAGWAGTLIPTPGGGESLVIGRFSGAASTVLSLSSHMGAPVTAEEGIVSGSMSTLALSSPPGAARWEDITCWLSAGLHGAVDARQEGSPGAVTVTNPGQGNVLVTARYLSTGRPCVLTDEDGRQVFRIPARRDLGEVHFYLDSGRTVTLRY